MYSDYIKHRAILHYKYILKSLRKVSMIYKIGKSTLSRWLKADGTIVERKRSSKAFQKDINDFIEKALSNNPFLTCMDLSKLIRQQLNKEVSKSTVWKFIKANNISYKRTKPYVSKQNTQIQINTFVEQYHDDVISIDETFFYLYDYPKYGYSKKGTPLRRAYNHTPRKRKITLYMAISNNKIIGYQMSTKHGNAVDFTSFVNNLNLQNKVLLLDNVAFHKTKIFKDAMSLSNNKLLYTPPYSPQFNPIELAFSKIKSSYRKLNYIKSDSLEANIKESIQTVTVTDLCNYYRHVATIVQKNLNMLQNTSQANVIVYCHQNYLE